MGESILSPPLRQLLLVFAVVAVASLVTAAILLSFLWRRLRRLQVAPGSGFWETLRQVPLGLVVLLDLLDLALDVFAAPVVWVLLGKLNLRQLRDVATIEALVPITGVLPTMTICWLLARLGLRDTPRRAARGAGTLLEGEEVAPGKWRPRQ